MQSVGVKANAWQRGYAVTDLDPQGPRIRAHAAQRWCCYTGVEVVRSDLRHYLENFAFDESSLPADAGHYSVFSYGDSSCAVPRLILCGHYSVILTSR